MTAREPIDLRNLPPAQYEIIAAMAVQAICAIANYEDPEVLRADEENNEDDDGNITSGYGLDPEEVIEMAYDNVLATARRAYGDILQRAKLHARQGV